MFRDTEEPVRPETHLQALAQGNLMEEGARLLERSYRRFLLKIWLVQGGRVNA
jgi:hypothetical protein